MIRWSSAIAGLAALAGCTVGPDFVRPSVPAPTAFGTTPANVPSRFVAQEVDTRWWDAFGDPELTALVGRLAASNLDLEQAAERVEQARAMRAVAGAQGLPRIDGQASYARQRQSQNGPFSQLVPQPDARSVFNNYTGTLSASWELDLFGRVRRSVEAANANTQAMVEARRGLALMAISELAQTYFQLRQAQAQQVVLERNLRIANDRRALIRDRFANGVATTLDVAQADSQSLGIAQDLPTLRTQQARLINALGLLLAEPPRTLTAELSRPDGRPLALPATVPVGLPAELARRRPDVREAEADLHVATAQTGVAVASFYPSITLNGSFGYQSLGLGTLFDGMSQMYMAGPGVNVPIFQGGRLTGTLRLREAQQREAALRYRQVVLQAWHDVDNAMVGYAEAQRRREDATATLGAQRRALAAADQRYREGLTSLLDVIVAQQGVLSGESTLVTTRTDVETRLVDLYRALGGGWESVPDRPDRTGGIEIDRSGTPSSARNGGQ